MFEPVLEALGATYAVHVLRVKIDWKSAFWKGVSQFWSKFWYKGRPPPKIFSTIWWASETLLQTVFTQRNFVADFLQENCTIWMKNGHFAFLSPLWRANRQHMVFILGSLESASGLPISDNWPFLRGVMAKALRANRDWTSDFRKRWGQFGPKFQVQGVVPHQPFFLSEN